MNWSPINNKLFSTVIDVEILFNDPKGHNNVNLTYLDLLVEKHSFTKIPPKKCLDLE